MRKSMRMSVLAMAVWGSAAVCAQALTGGGVPGDPYLIGSYADLQEFAQVVNGTHAAIEENSSAWGVLAADIAATEADWVGIGTEGYYGTFDGAGHVISRLENAGTPEYAGLFLLIEDGGVVRNVRLAEVAFDGDWAGGVVASNVGTVSNCCVSGSVRGGGNNAGGIVGLNQSIGTVANCYNTATVSVSGGEDTFVGGVVGINVRGTVANCHSTGAVSGGSYRGGVVGYNEWGTVVNSYCPDSLGVGAMGGGSGAGCQSLSATVYTRTSSFNEWDFDNVWEMGPETPVLRGVSRVYPLWVDGKQVWDGNEADILGNGSARYAGTKSWGTLMLTNAVITNAVEYQSGWSYTAGIYAGDGFDLTISLDGSNRVENASGNGIVAKENLSLGGAGSLTVESGANGIGAGGTLRIEDATVVSSGFEGFHSNGNIVLTNATVSVAGNIIVISAYGTVVFAGASRVEATATNNPGYAVYADGGITVGAELNLVEPDGGGLDESRKYFLDADGNDALHVLLESTVAYDLWVGGVQVCRTNAGDIFGDGSARFEGTAAGGTLALSGAVITNAVAYDGGVATAGIYAGDGFDLTISLDGSNQVANAREYGDGIRTGGDLSLCGAGSLTAKGGKNATGIDADGNLRIESATVAASGDYGLSSQRNIDFTNATVTATGAVEGISAIGAIAFTGESRVEATTTDSDLGAIFAGGGITMGDRIGVALPVGGGVSGTTITDAGGDTATNAIVAYFYDITVNGGSTTNSPSAAGFPVEIVADPPGDGKAFVQWSSNDGVEFDDAGASPTTFPMPATNVTVTAVSAEIVITWEGETEYTYTGSAITPGFTVSLKDVDLHVGTNYVASWAGNTNAGTATVSVTLTNRPSGVQSNSFRIKPKPLEDGMVQLTVPDAGWWTYNGEAPQPGFSLSDGNPSALTTSDIVVSWINNDAPGWATAVFVGTNNYTGQVRKSFLIVPAQREFTVTAGKWGAVAVETNGVELATVGPDATEVLPVGYGSSVTATAVPDAGFAVAGSAGAFASASFTENTNLVFSFVPNPDAALRWKFSSAVGRYFAQVAIPAHAGYDEALEGLAYLFADRTNNVGDVYAQLWNTAARAPEGVLVTDNGVPYRGVALGAAAFAGQAEGARVVWGVSDASFAETRNIVPAGAERLVGLYVRKRVNPVSGNETAGEVENFLGYLTWVTDGARWFLPVVEGQTTQGTGRRALAAGDETLVGTAPRAVRRVPYAHAYSPATLSAAVALGLQAAAVASAPPVARIAAFAVGADGAVGGRVEVVAGGEASSSFGGAATVRILSAESLGGPWREAASAEVDPATGAFSLPAGAVEGHFFRAEVETRTIFE